MTASQAKCQKKNQNVYICYFMSILLPGTRMNTTITGAEDPLAALLFRPWSNCSQSFNQTDPCALIRLPLSSYSEMR